MKTSSVKETKNFPINDNYSIVCKWIKTSYGFKHEAILKNQYFQDIQKTKCTYYNRIWESFEYETVISQLLQKSKLFSDTDKKNLLDIYRKNEFEEINKKFAFIGTIAKMGNILTNNETEKNDWKKRMLQAGLPELDIPADWNELSESEKSKRLDNVIAELTK